MGLFNKKWFFIILLIKLLIFGFFAINYNQNRAPEKIIKTIAVVNPDTPGCLEPIENFVKGGGYNSICRMPGLLPVYAPLSFLFGNDWAKAIIVLFQLVVSAISVYFLALLAYHLFQLNKAFYFTAITYSLSTFVAIWDNNLLTDSFAVSFTIIGLYLLFRAKYNQKYFSYIIAAGTLIAWSVFLRPISILTYVACFCMLFLWEFKKENGGIFIKKTTLFFLPLIISISCWTAYNYSKTNRFIPFTASFGECFRFLSPEHLEIRKLIIAMGDDFQPWAAGSGAEWFFQQHKNYREKNPFTANSFTSAYNLDSLIILKENYAQFSTIESDSLKKIASARIFNSVPRFLQSYKQEKALNFYVFNRFKLLKKFLFPTRLDDLPFPKQAEMKIYHKVIKAIGLIALNLVNLLGLIAIVIIIIKKQWHIAVWAILPLTFFIVLGAILGFIEQRYLVPCYPFMLLAINYIYVNNRLLSKSKKDITL